MRVLFVVGLLILLQACAGAISKPEATEVSSAKEGIPAKTNAPRYPAIAAANGIEGHVCFLFTIKTDGSVSDLRIYDSQPEGVFDYEATRAISLWRFRPATVDGSPIDTPNMKYCIDYRLSED